MRISGTGFNYYNNSQYQVRCVWREADELGFYNTACKRKSKYTSNYKNCIYCGKPITIVKKG